ARTDGSLDREFDDEGEEKKKREASGE
ncbi:MAG: hypothetical protein RL275_3520, partial [Chloroflexota bacterium]